LNQDFIQNIQLFYVFKRNFIGGEKTDVFIITNDDKVYAVGSNVNGVLGFGHENSVNELTINEELSHKRIVDFNNGLRHTIARNSDGKVYCWGRNVCGILGNGRNDLVISKPELNQYLNGKHIIDICCGAGHSLVLTIDDDVYAWGRNDDGQIGNGKSGGYQLMPYHVKGFDGQKVKAISCGFYHSMALTETGNVFS
jgi:alpha-tubulin suppressor-like RCC1 family protein